jgi:hypothetical protein
MLINNKDTYAHKIFTLMAELDLGTFEYFSLLLLLYKT